LLGNQGSITTKHDMSGGTTEDTNGILTWVTDEPLDKLYATFWIYINPGVTDPRHGLKRWRLYSVQDVNLLKAQGYSDGTFYLSHQMGGYLQDHYYSSLASPYYNWYKIEIQVKQSTSSDGSILVQSGYPSSTIVDILDLPSTETTASYNWEVLSLGEYCTQCCLPGATCDMFTYFDDVYLDNSWARVMLGDASTYSACTVREPQLIDSWSDSSITITANQGTFQSGQAYVYVVDENGDVSNSGIGEPVTIGQGTGQCQLTNAYWSY